MRQRRAGAGLPGEPELSRMQPDVVFIGPTRSGTTWVDAYLRSRGDVALPQKMKESFFFDKRYDRGIDWYRSLFSAGPYTRLAVEVAPSLFHKPQATERLADALSEATVVVTLRNPIERAVSHYFHYRRAGQPALPFMEMVRRKPDIVEAGLYHKHLARWRRTLGDDRVHTLVYDDLRRDPEMFCAQLCARLGLPYAPPYRVDREELAANPGSLPPFPFAARWMSQAVRTARRMGADGLVNSFRSVAPLRAVFGRPVKPEIRSDVAAQAWALRGIFLEDLEQLEAMLGRDLGSWRKGGSCLDC